MATLAVAIYFYVFCLGAAILVEWVIPKISRSDCNDLRAPLCREWE